MKNQIVIGCDNAATNLKKALITFMEAKGYDVEDVGCSNEEDKTAYPLIAKRVCENIIDSNYTKRGVLLCGTGLGVAMCANKFKGIRAGVCHDSFSGERLALSNNGNVICFGERIIGIKLAEKILGEWLELEFKDGPSSEKVEAILNLEEETMK